MGGGRSRGLAAQAYPNGVGRSLGRAGSWRGHGGGGSGRRWRPDRGLEGGGQEEADRLATVSQEKGSRDRGTGEEVRRGEGWGGSWVKGGATGSSSKGEIGQPDCPSVRP